MLSGKFLVSMAVSPLMFVNLFPTIQWEDRCEVTARLVIWRWW